MSLYLSWGRGRGELSGWTWLVEDQEFGPGVQHPGFKITAHQGGKIGGRLRSFCWGSLEDFNKEASSELGLAGGREAGAAE
jgi:hypothetical protein